MERDERLEREEEFARWFRLHNARLVAQCVRVLGDRAAAEDVAQETLLRAWLGRERMREEDLGAWLSVVARNLCISHIRRQKRAFPTAVIPETPDECADPARILERAESRRAVRRAMRTVDERHRVLLFRKEVEGVEYRQLGAELGLTAGGARSVLFRARRVLRDRLAAAGEGLAGIAVGFKARLQSVVHRLQHPASILEPIAAQTLQAGLGLALAAGIVAPGMFTHLFDARSAQRVVSRSGAGVVAGADRSASGLATGAGASAMAGSAATSNGRGRAHDPPIAAKHNPYNGDTSVKVDPPGDTHKGHTVHVTTVGDGHSYIGDVQEIVATQVCSTDPRLCAFLEGH